MITEQHKIIRCTILSKESTEESTNTTLFSSTPELDILITESTQ